MRRPVFVVGLVLAGLLLTSQLALGAARDPQKRLTAEGARIASAVLLTRTDLGSGGWKSGAPGATSSACGIVTDLQPNESALVESGAASGPVFSNKANQAMTQTVRVYATSAQASAAWKRTVTKNLVICMEQQV